MSEYTVIYDAVAWSTGSVRDQNLEYHTLARGEDVPDDVPAEKIKDWLNAEKHTPHGAIAKKGSRLATLGAVGASVATDPAEGRRRFLEAAGEDAVIYDPAGRPADKPSDTQDAGVANSRTFANVGTGTAQIAPDPSGSPALDVDSMKKPQLQAMADGLGLEYAKSDSVEELRDKIRARMAGGSAPTPPQE